MEPTKLKCRFCQYLGFVLKDLHDHCRDEHLVEFANIKLQLKDVEAKLRQLVEGDIDD